MAEPGRTGVRAHVPELPSPNCPKPRNPHLQWVLIEAAKLAPRLQLHSGGKGRMRFRDIYVRDLTHP